MKIRTHISKSVAYLILTVMAYMHLCSAMCAVGSNTCVERKDNDQDHCKKTCCETTKNNDGKTHDCQDMHLSFFNTTGQFPTEKITKLTNVFRTFVAHFTLLYNVLPVSQNIDGLAYNGFHPPPPKADIRIFIKSFQI